MGKSLRIIAGGIGVGAAAPFAAGDYTVVSLTSPPFIFGGRLKQLVDPQLSIIAPGLGPALRTFAMGAQVGVGPGNAESVLLGDNIIGAPGIGANAAARQILIGTDIVQLAGFANLQDTIIVGTRPTFVNGTGQFGNSVFIGPDMLIGGPFGNLNAVGIGANMRSIGGVSVTIGQGAAGDGESVIIGQAALGTGHSQAVGIGRAVRLDGAFQGGIAIGFAADGRASFSIGLGWQATPNVSNSICIGRNTFANTQANSIVIGAFGVAALIGDCIIGNGVNNPVNRLVIGPYADLAGTYPGLTWQLTNSNVGVDQLAPNLKVIGGSNTGAAVGGELIFQTSDVGGSGAAQQTVRERFAIIASSGATGPGGAIVRFSNFADGGGGNLVTWTNVPTPTTPVWLPVMYDVGGGPALGYIPIVPA